MLPHLVLSIQRVDLGRGIPVRQRYVVTSIISVTIKQSPSRYDWKSVESNVKHHSLTHSIFIIYTCTYTLIYFNRLYWECGTCSRWFHPECLGLCSKDEPDVLVCPDCQWQKLTVLQNKVWNVPKIWRILNECSFIIEFIEKSCLKVIKKDLWLIFLSILDKWVQYIQ